MSDADVIKGWPKVSVIVPVYNCEPYLQQTLDSIYAQNYPNLEIIVVNDGSTDKTSEIAKNNLSEINYFEQENQGSAVARNRAVSESSGDYLAFLDSDDLWIENHLKKQVEYLIRNKEKLMCYGDFEILYPDDFDKVDLSRKLSSTGIEDKGWMYHEMLFDSHVHIITAVIRKELYDLVGGFRDEFLRGQDYDFWIRASRITPFSKVNGVVAYYRQNSQGVTKNPMAMDFRYEALTSAYQKWGLVGPDGSSVEKKTFMKHLGHITFGFGYLHYHLGNKRIAFDSLWKSLKYNPWRVKTWVYIFLSFFSCVLDQHSELKKR